MTSVTNNQNKTMRYTATQNKTLKETRSKDKATSKEACDILEKVFKGVSRMRLQTLWDELEAMKMKDSEDVSSYITRVQTVTNQLKHNGETLTDARSGEDSSIFEG